MRCFLMSGMRVELKSAPKATVLRPLVRAVLLTLSAVNMAQADVLTYLGAQGNVGGSQGLGGASRVAISPDNLHAYVVAPVDRCLGVFSQSGGVVSQQGFCSSINDNDSHYVPVSVVVSADGKNVYAVVKAFYGAARVLIYTRANDGTISAPTFYDKLVPGLDDVFDLIVSADGRNVYVSGFNAVIVFARDATTGQLNYVETKSDGIGGVDGLAGTFGLSLSADGKHLYAAGSADNAVAVFARNVATGQLSFVELQRDNTAGVDGLAGARSLALSPDGTNLYVAGSDDDAVSVFKRDPISGKLSYQELWKDGSSGVDGLNGVSTVVVSPNGSQVFAGAGAHNGTPDNAIAVFKRLPQSGRLEFVEFHKDGVNGVDGLQGVQSLALNPTGSYLFAASSIDGAGKVAVFKTANAVPQASADIADVTAGESITLQVLANDTDSDDDVLLVTGADDKSKNGGSITVNADNTITYVAAPGFTGTDTFNYLVSDVRNATPQLGVVTVTVKAASGSVPVVSASGATASAEDSGGGGSVDSWLGLLLLGAGALRRRFVF